MRFRKIILLIIFSVNMMVLGCGYSEVGDSIKGLKDHNEKHVQIVRNGSLNNYPQVKIGDAFDAFFENPQWSYLKASSGEDVVEFSGNCTYQSVKVRAKLQFIFTGPTSFKAGALTLNDVPQMVFMTGGLIEKVYEKNGTKQPKKQEEVASDTNETMNPSSNYEIIPFDKLVVQGGKYPNRKIQMAGTVEAIFDKGSCKDILLVVSKGNEAEPKRVAILESNNVTPEIGAKILAYGIYSGNRKEYKNYSPQIAQLPVIKLEKIESK